MTIRNQLGLVLVLCGAATLSAQTANLWIDTNGGTCTRQATPAAYVDAQACSNFTAAYNAASAGDTIYVKAGTYGSQTVPSRSLGSVYTTISAAPGETVNTGAMDINTNWIVVNGFHLGNNAITIGVAGSGGTCSRNHVIISNNVLAGTAAAIGGGCGDNIQIIGNDISGINPCVSGGYEDSLVLTGDAGGGVWGESPPTNLLIKNNYIHDQARAYTSCSPGPHTDGTQLAGCIHCVFDGNIYNNTDTSFIIIYEPGGTTGKLQDIQFRNNSFGTVLEPGNGLSVGGDNCHSGTNFIVENNTFYSGTTLGINCLQHNDDGIARNNIFTSYDYGAACGSSDNLTMSRNVFGTGAGTCGSNPKQCNVSFADPAHTGGNVDLSPSDTCAKDAIPATGGTYPATDIHGTARPQGAAVDAGADEYGTGTPSVSPTSMGPWTRTQVVVAGTAGGTLTAGNFAGTVTWSRLTGTLPNGIVSAAGSCQAGTTTGTTCTNTGTLNAAGSFSFTIRATDGTSTVDTPFSVTVNDVPSITTTSPLPSGQVNVSYSQVLAKTGGTGTITCSAASGLPPGLSIPSGCTISGTPTTVGTYDFNVTPTDANSVSGSPQGFQITVAPPDTSTPVVLHTTFCGPGATWPGTCTIPSTAAGSRLVVVYASYNSAGSTPVMNSITDGGDTFAQLANARAINTAGGASSWNDVWSGIVAAGRTTLTITTSTSQSGDVYVWELQYADNIVSCGALSSQPAADTAIGPALSVGAKAILLGYLHPMVGGSPTSVSSPFITDLISDGLAYAHYTTSSAGTYSPQWAQTAATFAATLCGFTTASAPASCTGVSGAVSYAGSTRKN